MAWIVWAAAGCVALALLAYWLGRRPYASSQDVADNYDHWTRDGLLERLWGEHIHLGYYGDPPHPMDFRASKARLVHELVRWGGLDQLPPGSRLLDVGCGIGGSARILARDYGFNVLGVSISREQILRATTLTPDHLTCRFAVMDALSLSLEEASFDAVWSVEAGPHIPHKQRFADEMLRLLKPGGKLVVADWNQRDTRQQPLNRLERGVMSQLLEQWGHAEFSSIESFRGNLRASPYSCRAIETANWSRATAPAWIDAIREGFRRPGAVLSLGPGAVVQALRETPTILLMAWAWQRELMRFGVFRASRCSRDVE